MVKIIIAGGRDFVDYDYFKTKMDSAFPDKSNMEIVSGGAKGVDAMAERFAQEQNVPVKIFPADWKAFGRAAGPKRNQQMAEYANSLFAFWDGKSPGTKSMLKIAMKNKLRMIVMHDYINGLNHFALYDNDIDEYEGSATILALKDSKGIDLLLQLKPQKTSILKTEADKELFFNALLNPPKPNASMIELMENYKKKRSL